MANPSPITIRPTFEELNYLDEHNFTPSEFWHLVIKNNMKLEKSNIRRNSLYELAMPLFLVLFGGLFFLLSLSMVNVLQMVVMAVMGIFLSLYGFVLLLNKKSGKEKTL